MILAVFNRKDWEKYIHILSQNGNDLLDIYQVERKSLSQYFQPLHWLIVSKADE